MAAGEAPIEQAVKWIEEPDFLFRHLAERTPRT
jgi:hypothetical protein